LDNSEKSNPIPKRNTKKKEGTTNECRDHVCEMFGVMKDKPWLRGSATEVYGGVDICTSMVDFRSWGASVGDLR